MPAPQAPIDPSVKVPAAVAAAAALANELLSSTAAPPQIEPALQAAPAPENPPQEAESPPPEPVQQPPKAEPPEEGPGDSWKNRYSALKGRYDREIPNLQSQLAQQAGQIDQLQGLLASLSAPTPPAKPEGELKPAPTRYVTDEDEQEWGPEFFKAVEKKAREIAEAAIAEIRGEVQTLGQRVEGVGTFVAHTEHDKKLAFMDHHLPNWRQINESMEFKQWLALRDPFSGRIRDSLLKEAWDANDAPRSLNFWTAFLADVGASPSPAGGPPVEPAPRVSLEELAAPGRAVTGASAQAGTPAEAPSFTRAQITKFYDDVRRGVYAGKEAERANTERDIFAAQAAGRIRN